MVSLVLQETRGRGRCLFMLDTPAVNGEETRDREGPKLCRPCLENPSSEGSNIRVAYQCFICRRSEGSKMTVFDLCLTCRLSEGCKTWSCLLIYDAVRVEETRGREGPKICRRLECRCFNCWPSERSKVSVAHACSQSKPLRGSKIAAVPI